MAVHAYNLKGGAPVNFQWPIENAIYNLIYPMYPIYPIYLIYLNEDYETWPHRSPRMCEIIEKIVEN